MKVTGSSIYQAIECDSSKRQKVHFENVINGVPLPHPPGAQQKAMQRGTDCEVHHISTIFGIKMAYLYSDLTFQEEISYVKDNVLVSPDVVWDIETIFISMRLKERLPEGKLS